MGGPPSLVSGVDALETSRQWFICHSTPPGGTLCQPWKGARMASGIGQMQMTAIQIGRDKGTGGVHIVFVSRLHSFLGYGENLASCGPFNVFLVAERRNLSKIMMDLDGA